MAQPDDQALRAVRSLADTPEACARLTQLVVTTEHLEPKVVGRLVVDHARTLETLASVVEHRDRVPGATVPALLGLVSEVRAHAAALVGVRAAAREWRSAVPGDPRPPEQMAQIRAQLGRDRRQLRRNPTDADLWAAVEALRPALQFAPALQQAVRRSVDSGAWRPLRAGDDGSQPKAALLAAVDGARDTAVHAVDALPASLRQAPTDGRGTPVDLAEVRTADDVVVWLRSEQGRYLDAHARADDPVHEAAFRKIAATLDALATVMDTGLSDRAAAGALTDLSRRYRIPAETQAEGTDPDYRLATTHLAHLVDRVAAQLTGVVNRRPHQAASAPTTGLHLGRDL